MYALANVYAYVLGHGHTLDVFPPFCLYVANYGMYAYKCILVIITTTAIITIEKHSKKKYNNNTNKQIN